MKNRILILKWLFIIIFIFTSLFANTSSLNNKFMDPIYIYDEK